MLFCEKRPFVDIIGQMVGNVTGLAGKWSFVDVISQFVEKSGHLADYACDMKIGVVYL